MTRRVKGTLFLVSFRVDVDVLFGAFGSVKGVQTKSVFT